MALFGYEPHHISSYPIRSLGLFGSDGLSCDALQWSFLFLVFLSNDSTNLSHEVVMTCSVTYWPIEWTMRSNYRCNKAYIRIDRSDNKAINKPNLERSPGNQYNKDHKVFNSLNKEFRT